MSKLLHFRGKKVLLTGHTGFKGSWLAQWLLDLGASVRGFSKDIPTNPSLFETLELSKQLDDIRADIRDLPALEREIRSYKPDVIFHLAAQPLVRLSYDSPLETFHENTLGTANVMEAVRKVGGVSAMVVITTDKVYENRGWEFGYRENDPLGGHDPYSASKAAAEIVFSSYCRSFFNNGTRMCSARAGNVIGGGDWAKDRIVPDCIRAWQSGSAVELRNPSSIRPWEHVLEPIGGYLLLADRLLRNPDGVHGEAFNFGPAGDLDKTTLELVSEMEKHWSGAQHKTLTPVSDGKKEASYLRLNCDKVAARLQWLPRLSFAETVAWTSKWYWTNWKQPTAVKELTLSQIREYSSRLG